MKNNSKHPISMWKEMTKNNFSQEQILENLKQIYINNPPELAEIIFNSFCSQECIHCIYPSNYHLFNKNLSLEEWKKITRKIYDIGLKTFIFGGRQLNKDLLEIVKFLKTNFKDTQVGLIADGPAINLLKQELLSSPVDWIDISIDGLEKQHDKQRLNKGSFKKTIEFLKEAKDKVKKITIMTCITTINIDSTIDLIKYLNNLGIKNIVINPISILDNQRPDPSLRVSQEAFIKLLKDVLELYPTLNDSWIHFDLFSIEYLSYIKKGLPKLYQKLKDERQSLTYEETKNNNDLRITYSPLSLTGVKEFIINSDANSILPLVMGFGKIPKNYLFFNLKDTDLKNIKDISKTQTQTKAFEIYKDFFLKEKKVINS